MQARRIKLPIYDLLSAWPAGEDVAVAARKVPGVLLAEMDHRAAAIWLEYDPARCSGTQILRGLECARRTQPAIFEARELVAA